MSERVSVPDAQLRRLAETTFDRNVVVVAGAGTGKTTLLVNRLIHLLMQEPRPAEITQIVALTFTNKAATEMKVRLRERLMALLTPSLDESEMTDPGAVRSPELRERYGLSSDRIAARAEAALRDLEKAQIGTLHSFAAHLLRLHPIESGLDPDFEEDDGLRFQEHFAAQWELWLDSELGPNGPNHDRWRRLLTELSLAQLREVAYALTSELVPLDELTLQIRSVQLSPALREWFSAKRARTAELLAAHDRPKRRKVESLLAAAHELFRAVLEQGINGVGTLEAVQKNALCRDLGDCPAGWNEDEFAEASHLIRIAKKVLAVDRGLMEDLLAVLTPFAQLDRASFLERGWISFDGLLARARTLLRDHSAIRERLKHEYQAVLVDEFQDTDPVQYEIILYLAEQPGRCHATWRDVELTPGKLFIVGDPKQSIYAFRRADIEAFDQVVDKILSSGGVACELTTNFRSHGKVLEVINALFDRLLCQKENVQPANVPLVVRPNRQAGISSTGVELYLVKASNEVEEFDAAAATRIEADQLARWLKDDLFAHETLIDATGLTIPLKPGHVALLFRKLTQAQDYLEALRRHDIPYVTDGEKHFYRRQEVVDLVNLLRLVENPHDMIALVGVLRSPLGGVTDRELCELREREALDYRRADRLASWNSQRAPTVRRLYDRLIELHEIAPGCPLHETVDLLLTKLPVLELATSSLHGEQAVANVYKVRQIATELADRPHITLTGFVELMIARLSEQPEEAESALAEESLEAVRVLTIHKAKGLEFPVVILPGLHHGAATGSEAPLIAQDWSTSVLGVSLGERSSLGAVLVGEKLRAREEAERRRVLYVGMTRAKERLILSGGLSGRPARGTFLALLQDATDGGVGEPGQATVQVGPVSFSQTVVTATDQISRSRRPVPTELRPPPDWTSLVQLWQQRDRAWEVMCSTPRHLTPSFLMKQEHTKARSSKPGAKEPNRPRLIGILAHRILEGWDFTTDPEKLEERVEAICLMDIPPDWADQAQEITAELQELFSRFATSELYEELRRATVLGHEVPFTISWESEGRGVMEGIIDLIYRLDGQIWVVDYKTDRLRDDEVADRATAYRSQARVYIEAVSRCLGLEKVGFKFLFLRNGLAVQA